MAGVETGSLNFGKEPFVTIPADARRVVERAGALDIALEAEMFDVGHVVQANAGARRAAAAAPRGSRVRCPGGHRRVAGGSRRDAAAAAGGNVLVCDDC